MLDPSILGRSIPVAALCGDQHSALFGQGCFDAGYDEKHIRNRLLSADEHGRSRLPSARTGWLSTIAWRLNGTCHLRAGRQRIRCGGAAIQWLRDEMKLIIERASENGDHRALPARITAACTWCPTFTGLGRAVLGYVQPGHDHRAYAGDGTCACCSRGAGIHRVSIGRSGQRDGFRLRAQAVGTPRGRRREREPAS